MLMFFSIKFVISMSFLHKLYKTKKGVSALMCTFYDFIQSFFNSSFLETKAIKCTSHEKMSLINEKAHAKGRRNANQKY